MEAKASNWDNLAGDKKKIILTHFIGREQRFYDSAAPYTKQAKLINKHMMKYICQMSEGNMPYYCKVVPKGKTPGDIY